MPCQNCCGFSMQSLSFGAVMSGPDVQRERSSDDVLPVLAGKVSWPTLGLFRADSRWRKHHLSAKGLLFL